MAESSAEYKYWYGMCHQSVQNDVLQLENGAQFVSRDNTMTGPLKLFVRPCYSEMIALIMDQTSRNAVVTGTPGVGKTMLRNVLVHVLIQHCRERKQPFCIVLDKSPSMGNALHVFKATFDGDGGSLSWSASIFNKVAFSKDRDLPAGHPVWYLLDVSEGKSADRIALPGCSRTIMFTSPDEAAYKEFVKQDCVKYFMPLWSKDEANKARQLTTSISGEVFSERWDKYGGVARALFASDQELLTYEVRVEEALTTLDAQGNFNYLGEMNGTSSIKHLLFYLEVDTDPTNLFRRGHLNFGTDYIKGLVTQRLSHQ